MVEILKSIPNIIKLNAFFVLDSKESKESIVDLSIVKKTELDKMNGSEGLFDKIEMRTSNIKSKLI
jgi:predicted transcriptional regulator|tara:strand:- start:59 stop:256 length:198 start_codon:yes stop_codon:yes gene_type:complete